MGSDRVVALIACIAPGLVCTVSPVQAGTLPRADFAVGTTLGVDAAHDGLNFSWDAAASKQWSAGCRFGVPTQQSGFGGRMFEGRLLYRLLERDARMPDVSFLVGTRIRSIQFSTLFTPQSIGSYAGFGFAYAVFPQVLLRVTVAPELLPELGWGGSGAEVAYRLQPNLEATLSARADGGYLGARTSL
jgi:hypothetical protein